MLTCDQDAYKMIELQREIETVRIRIRQAEKIISAAQSLLDDLQENLFDMQDTKWK